MKAKRESKIAIGGRPPGVPGGSGRLPGVGLHEGIQREKLTRLPARGDSAADSALLDAKPLAGQFPARETEQRGRVGNGDLTEPAAAGDE